MQSLMTAKEKNKYLYYALVIFSTNLFPKVNRLFQERKPRPKPVLIVGVAS